MPDARVVADHYARENLVAAIRAGLERSGKWSAGVDIDDLGPVDEFHVGGREATERLLGMLDLGAQHHVLDAGCGLGGASRVAAHRFGCRVTGVDLTPDYVAAGRVLCDWTGLAGRVQLDVGDVTELAVADTSFDRAFMLHVGMNVADKAALAKGLWRAVKPGGLVGIYDIMRQGEGELVFPVPWARDTAGSAVASPAEYRAAFEAAGFIVVAEHDRREFALDFFARLAARTARTEAPSPLGLHLVIGPDAARRIANLVDNVKRGCVAPCELLLRRGSSS